MVRVYKLNRDGTAQVAHERLSACSGDCHKCAGCGAVSQTMILTARNPIGAQPGDLVIIRSGSGKVLAAAAVLYIIPLVLFFGCYLLGETLWQLGGLMGCAGFFAGIAVAAVYDRRVLKKKKTVYTITGYGREVPPS